MSNVATTDFSKYDAILAGSDTDSMSSWGDSASVSAQHVGIYLPEIPSNIVVLGREVESTSHYPLTLERNTYLLWGFTASPESMIEVGKDLFINVVSYMTD